MQIRPAILILCLVLGFVSHSSADPTNFMIEGLTFGRPAKWDWIVPDSNARKAQLRFVDRDKSVDTSFYWYPAENKQGDPEDCIKRWQAQFRNKNQVQTTIESDTVGKFKVTYAQMEGVYKGFGKESPSVPLPDYALIGAVVPTGKGAVVVRMTGPKELVYKTTKTFKKMIEDALKEESSTE